MHFGIGPYTGVFVDMMAMWVPMILGDQEPSIGGAHHHHDCQNPHVNVWMRIYTCMCTYIHSCIGITPRGLLPSRWISRASSTAQLCVEDGAPLIKQACHNYLLQEGHGHASSC